MISPASSSFRRFSPHEFEFGEDLPWLHERSDRASWDLITTKILWSSAWRMLLPLMRRPGITEIMIRGANRIFVETQEGFHLTTLTFDPNQPAPIGWPEGAKRPKQQDLLDGLARIYEATEKRKFWAPNNPMGDVRAECCLEDGSRLQGEAPAISVNGEVAINIRRFSPVPYTMDDLIAFQSLTPEAADVIRMAVRSGSSMMVVAGCGAGKTAMLQIAIDTIPSEKVPLTLEDTPELRLEHWLGSGFRTRPRASGAQADFQEIRYKEMFEIAMRSRPDWIISGEIRDADGAAQFIKAINSGHAGMTTFHAHDAFGALQQMQAMLAEVRSTVREESLRTAIGEAIRLIVVMERVGEFALADSGEKVQKTRRRVKEIVEILGSDGRDYFINPLFRTKVRTQSYRYGNQEMLFPERYLEQVGIPFFGMELKAQGESMPDWWENAQFQFVSQIPVQGRVALTKDVLQLPCSLTSSMKVHEDQELRIQNLHTIEPKRKAVTV